MVHTSNSQSTINIVPPSTVDASIANKNEEADTEQ